MENVNFNPRPFGKDNDEKKLDFPINYDLKVILETDKEINIQQRNLELVLEDADVNYDFVKSQHSSKGNFVSLTMNITLLDKDQMGYLYHRLKLLPGIKFAV